MQVLVKFLICCSSVWVFWIVRLFY